MLDPEIAGGVAGRSTTNFTHRTVSGTTPRNVIVIMYDATRVLNRRKQAWWIVETISATSVRATRTFLALLVVHSTCACSHSSFHTSTQTKPTTLRLSKLLIIIMLTMVMMMMTA